MWILHLCHCKIFDVIHINNPTPYGIKTENAKFANSVDLDETAQHEPSHLDLDCLPSSV